MAKRPEKNSERVEIRLPYRLKQRFLRACEKAGETPSEALRDAMADYILRIEQAGQPTLFEEMTMRLIHNPLKAAGMTLASLATFALVAAPSVADDALFASFDENEDGVLDANELDREVLLMIDRDHSETVEPDEFQAKLTTRETSDEILETGSGERSREVAFTIRKLELVQGEEDAEAHLNTFSCSTSIALDAREDDTQAEIVALTEKCERGFEKHSED